MRQIGEKFVLNGKTYEISGYHKKSYLLKDERGKEYKCGPEKLERMIDGRPRVRREQRQVDPNAIPKYIQRTLEFDKIFARNGRGPEPKLPETEQEYMDWFGRLTSELSPENLHCDGEISISAARAKERELKQAWRWLEAKIGRKVTEDQVYAYDRARRQS